MVWLQIDWWNSLNFWPAPAIEWIFLYCPTLSHSLSLKTWIIGQRVRAHQGAWKKSTQGASGFQLPKTEKWRADRCPCEAFQAFSCLKREVGQRSLEKFSEVFWIIMKWGKNLQNLGSVYRVLRHFLMLRGREKRTPHLPKIYQWVATRRPHYYTCLFSV